MKRVLSFVLIVLMALSLAACRTSPQPAEADPTEVLASPTAVPTEEPEALKLSEMSEEDCIATLRAFGAEIPEDKETGIMSMVMDFEENIDRPYPGDVYFGDEYSLFESVRAAVRAYYISIGAPLEPAPTETPEPTPFAFPEETVDKGPKVIQGNGVFFLVQPDGTVYGWGNNEYGQLGLGDAENRSMPVFVANGLTPVIVGDTVFALSEDNILWGWGRNDCGQLGLGDGENRARPVELMHFVKDIVHAGDNYYALTESGELYCWGLGININLVDGVLEPILVDENVEFFSPHCMIKNNGELWLERGDWMKIAENVSRVYGQRYYPSYALGTDGMLYYIDWENGLVPVCDDIHDVRIADYCAYILKNDGTLWSYSQMGDYHDVPEDQLNTLVYLMDNVIEIQCGWEMDEDWGYNYNFALKANGELWAWSMLYSNATVGKPKENQSTEPSCVATNVKKVVTNNAQTYIIKDDGSIWATGLSSDFCGGGVFFGSLGDGTEEMRYGFVELPLEGVVSVFSKLTEVFTEYDDGTDSVDLYARTFAVDAEGRIWAWGWNGDGLLGVNSAERDVLSPMEVHLTKSAD